MKINSMELYEMERRGIKLLSFYTPAQGSLAILEDKKNPFPRGKRIKVEYFEQTSDHGLFGGNWKIEIVIVGDTVWFPTEDNNKLIRCYRGWRGCLEPKYEEIDFPS